MCSIGDAAGCAITCADCLRNRPSVKHNGSSKKVRYNLTSLLEFPSSLSSEEIARLTDTQHESVRNQPILSGMQYLTREDRTKKVKDAKSEAQSEIEEYKKQKDDEFKAYEEKVGVTDNLQRSRY